MPVLNQGELTEQKLPNGEYGYSAARIDDLGASEYTLVTIVTDVSGSVTAFRQAMEATLSQIVQACGKSPRADNLLLRLVTFADHLSETHGFKLLDWCKPGDYAGCLKIGGSTALYDASENAIAATTSYARRLTDADFNVNGIVFILTDGMDNVSRHSARDVGAALWGAVTTEAMESLVSILIGVNVSGREVSRNLSDFRRDAGLTEYLEIGRADASSLARLANYVSRSVSAQSQALGTGGPSQTLIF